MITHIVLMKFKPESRDSNLRKVRDLLLGMVGEVPSLRHLEVGLNFTDSPRACDLALTTRFESRADLEAYAVDPAHLRVKEFIAGVAEASYVVDYES